MERHELAAAKLGCAKCGNPIKLPTTAKPLQDGPYQGRYLCQDCWSVIWSKSPEDLADDDTRATISEDAQKVELSSGAQVVFQEEDHRILLSSKGTLIFDIAAKSGQQDNEYDPERFALLVRALGVISKRDLPGFGVDPAGPPPS